MSVDWLGDVASARRYAAEAARAGRSIGLVPTMGYLHAGHGALLDALRPRVDVLVLSIFVNPTQFGPAEDLATYPRDLDRDRRQAEASGVDMVFCPRVEEMYPVQPCTFVTVEGLSRVLEGAVRPTHFRGVATVVAKLLNVLRPTVVAFGQKDAQQVIVVKRMVRELLLGTEVLVVPTVREADGLAMSSRNVYLSSAERAAAPILNESLAAAESQIVAGERDARQVAASLRRQIEQEPLAHLDYAAVVSADTLTPLDRIEGRVLLAVAARFGRARLLDNRCLEVAEDAAWPVMP